MEPGTLQLHPIYDAFENRNYTQALKHISTLQKKYEKSLVLSALKAYGLSRGEHHHKIEAKTISDELIANPKSYLSETVIEHLVLALKGLQDYKRIVQIYTTVCTNTEFKNKEMAIELFYAHARIEDYVKQQQIATKLYSIYKEKRFLYWAVISIVLQAPIGVPDHMSLKLALGMLEKGLTDVTNPEIVRIYVHVLEKMTNFEKIVSVLSGPLGLLLDHLPYDRKQMIADYSLKAKDYVTANAMYAYLLEKHNSDEWGWWIGYLETFDLLKGQEKKNVEISLDGSEKIKSSSTTTLEDAKSFIKTLQKNAPKSRGPFLAEIELATKNQDHTETLNLLGHYFKQFGSKPICFADVKMIVEKIQVKKVEGEELVAFVEKNVVSDGSESSILYDINVEKLKRHLRVYTQTHEEIISVLLSRFFTIVAKRKDIGEQKIGTKLGDDYILLVAHHSLDLFDKLKDMTYLQNAIAALEYGLTKNIHNFQFKILLCRLYSILGCVDKALEVFYKLDCKHIQWETLSYLVLYDVLATPGLTEKAIGLIEKINGFIREHRRDTAELMLGAYEKESYSKVDELIAFKHKMDESLQVSIVNTQEVLLKLFKNNSLITDSISFLNREISSIKSQTKWQINDDLDCPTLYETKKKVVNKIVHPLQCRLTLEERVAYHEIYQAVPALIQSSVNIYALNERKKPEKKKKEQNTEEWIPTEKIVKDDALKFSESLSKWEKLLSVKDDVNMRLLVQIFHVTKAFYGYLTLIKSGQSTNEDEVNKALGLLKDVLIAEISKFKPIIWTPALFTEFHAVSWQLIILVTIFSAWNSVLKKDKSVLRSIKESLVTGLNDMKNLVMPLQDSLFISEEKNAREAFAREFMPFYESIEKSVHEDINSAFSRVKRVISDLLMELETIRL